MSFERLSLTVVVGGVPFGKDGYDNAASCYLGEKID
jgi:hypothetical protein